MIAFALPPWNEKDNTVHGESGMFALKDIAKLLFPARSIQRVWCPRSGVIYQEGRDYSFEEGNDFITRPNGSDIPYISETALYPPDEKCLYYPAAGANAVPGKMGGGNIWFSATDDYAKAQIEIDYTAERIDFLPIDSHTQHDRLPGFRKKLAGQEDLRVTLLGDSISEGYNASRYINVPPFQPCYAELIHQFLSELHPGKLIWHNRAVNGTGCRHGLITILADWKKDHPDLLILAYGMNDFHAMRAEEFLQYNLKLIEEAREVNPAVEVMMIIPMTGNPCWEYTKPGKDAEFAKIIREYWQTAGPSLAIADVQKVWMQMMRRKGFYALTGNGVNHPNDFGHRIYASVVLSVITPLLMQQESKKFISQ